MQIKKKIALSVLFASTLAISAAVVGCTPSDSDGDNGDNEPTTYAVSYSVGEGTGTAPAGAEYKEGDKFNLPGQGEMSKEDYTFDGWSYNSQKYAAGFEFTMPASDVTFTAQWKANGTTVDPTDPTTPTTGLTVTYKAGEHGTGADIVQDKGIGGVISVANNLDISGWTIDTGWSISGWKLQGDATDTVYEYYDDYELTANVVFVAQYEETTELYSAYELDDKGIIILNLDGTGKLLYGEDSTANLTYTLSGTAITISIGGGSFTGTFADNVLTINFTYASTVYRFGEFAPFVPVKPTISFNANEGTGTAPVISDADIVYNETRQDYTIKLPQNTFTPPDGKVFKAWGYEKSGSIWDIRGTTYIAQSGESVVFYAIWKDEEPAGVVPTGMQFEGSCTVPEKRAGIGDLMVGRYTVTKIWVNTATDKIYYQLSTGDPAEIPSTDITKSPYNNAGRPTKYGSDALYYEIKIENVTLNILVKADGSELSLCDVNDEFLTDCEFVNGVAEFTVTYVKPAGVTGDIPAAETVSRGGQVTLAADTVFARDGWTFHNWKVSSYTTYRAPNTKIDVNANTTITPVFKKTYTGTGVNNLGSLIILDNGNAIVDGTEFPYEIDGNIIIIDCEFYFYYCELNETTKSYILLDDMYSFEFTAKDGTTKLTFDGKGGATLTTSTGTVSGSYALRQVDYDTLIDLTFNGTKYEDITIELDDDFNLIISVLITVDGTDYIFGNPPIEYTISFELGDGVTGTAPAAVTGIGGNSITLPSGDGLSKDGYKFVGWTIKGSTDNKVYKGSYPVSGAVTFVSAWTEDSGEEGEYTFADFVGSSSSSAVKYGYASVADAQAANQSVSATTSTGTTNTFYYASAYYAAGTSKLMVYIYYKATTGVSATTDASGQNISDINVDVFEVYVGSSSYPEKFAVNFSMQDGKRVMTVTYGETTVTWEEMTA